MMLFRRTRPDRPETAEEPPLAIPKFGPTADDLEAIADFIALRLALITPPMFPRPDDTGRAILALRDTAAVTRAMGDSLIQMERSIALEWVILCTIADRWSDHPDYRQEWAP